MRVLAVLLSLPIALLSITTWASESSRDGRRIKVVKDGLGIIAEVYSDAVVHFELSHDPAKQNVQAPIYTTPMVADGSAKAATISLRANGLSTARLDVNIDPDSLCVSVLDKALKRMIVRDCPLNPRSDWKGLTLETSGFDDVYGLGNYFKTWGSADGLWNGAVWDPGPQGNAIRPYGGGAPSYAMFPIIYALGNGNDGFAFFLDQVYKQKWSFNQSPWRVEMWGDQIRWFVIAGDNVQQLRQSYMRLTGLAPIPPKKTFGLWVSEFGYANWAEAYKPVVTLRQNGFPLDGLGMDLQWFGGSFFPNGADTRGSRMGKLEFDPNQFANFAHEVKSLHDDRGVSLMPIEESYISKFLPEHEQLSQRGFLARDCGGNGAPTYLDSNPWWGVGGMIDWTNPSAGDYWHDTKRQPLYQLGITTHWTDLGEPEMYSENACYYGFPEIGKTHHGDIHNIYNFKWLESIARGYERHHNHLRPYMMSRSGTSGLQRFGAGMWTGDLAANMGTMTTHYNVQMHMSLSGIDYLSSDVGGFHRRADTLDGDQNELYTQWFANAALFDFPIRPHVWNLSKTLKTAPDAIGSMDSNRFNIQQRYALAPYYYSLAYAASKQGSPVVAPMVYYFQGDRTVRAMGNQKMIGPYLMGALIAKYGQSERTVYLPKGTWYEFHSNAKFESQGQAVDHIPAWENRGSQWIFRVPLFARAGAIIPMMYVDNKTMNILGRREGGDANRDLHVRVYPNDSGSTFTLYEDDGETVDYKTGRLATTLLEQKRNGSSVTVTIHASQGAGFDGFPSQRNQILHLLQDTAQLITVTVNGKELKKAQARDDFDRAEAGWWVENSQMVHVKTGTLPVAQDKTVEIR